MIVAKFKSGGRIPSQPKPPVGRCFKLKNDKSATFPYASIGQLVQL